MTQLISREDVYAAIDKERDYQDQKYGVDKGQSLPGFITIMRAELAEAEQGWLKHSIGRHSALQEIIQLAATCVACLEKYGVDHSAISTDDIAYFTKSL